MIKYIKEVIGLQYLTTFLVGIISFISPCMLPMLPIYISYFSGNRNKKSKTFASALSFVTGFTLIFCLLGLFAGSIGGLLSKFHTAIEMICGIIIILLGMDFLGIINISFIKGFHTERKVTGLFSAFIFGVVFSISHAPCIGAFLGTALATASASGSWWEGIMELLAYSLGMGIPFLISALLIDKLSGAFDAIKRNYKIINLVCGILLILLGVFMATGLMHELAHAM